MNRIAAVGIGAALILLWFVNPETASWLPQCPLHAWTGWCCPGCGSTRALHQLLHGHLLAALQLNPLILALPLGAVRTRLRAPWVWALLTVVVAFGVVRNLPWYP